MNHQEYPNISIYWVLLWACGISMVYAAAPIDVGPRKQLFIDDKFIAYSKGVELTMNPPIKMDRPVLASDIPWNGEKGARVGWMASVIKDGDKIRIWGCGKPVLPIRKTPDGPVANLSPYIESTDGIHFTGPDPALVAYDESAAELNQHLRVSAMTVWVDPKAPPSERYKTQGKYHNADGTMAGFYFCASPDGYNWHYLHTLSIGDVDSQTNVFWDNATQQYLMYTRDNPGGQMPIRRRVVRRLESDDLIHWKNEKYVLDADEIDDNLYNTPTPQPPLDFYGATVFKYPDNSSDSVYMMLAHNYWHWQGRPEKDQYGEPSFHTYSQIVLAPAKHDVRLCASRDGIHFDRLGNRKVFIAPGLAGDYASKMVWAYPTPIRMGNELWIYYSGDNRDHDGFVDSAASERKTSLHRAVLRLDGFVSADAAYTGGEIVTPLITFSGRKLELNVDPGGGGCVQVELLDENDRPIKGYARHEATRMYDNSVNLTVTWGDNDSIAALAGKPIKLRFLMRDCKLYAFQFAE